MVPGASCRPLITQNRLLDDMTSPQPNRIEVRENIVPIDACLLEWALVLSECRQFQLLHSQQRLESYSDGIPSSGAYHDGKVRISPPQYTERQRGYQSSEWRYPTGPAQISRVCSHGHRESTLITESFYPSQRHFRLIDDRIRPVSQFPRVLVLVNVSLNQDVKPM